MTSLSGHRDEFGQKATAQGMCFLVESWSRGLKGFPVSTEPSLRSVPGTGAWQQTFLPVGNVVPAPLSHNVNLESSVLHTLSSQVLGGFCHKSPLVEVGSDFSQTVAYFGLKFRVTGGCIFPRTSVLLCSQQEWNCLTMPFPWGPCWKWDVSLMRTSQQAQMKYLCDCSSFVMNELIDFTLSFFLIDLDGPTVGKELCSSSSFPRSPVLFKGRWNGFRTQGRNPKTSVLDGSQMGHQAAHWVWAEGWELAPFSHPQSLHCRWQVDLRSLMS